MTTIHLVTSAAPAPGGPVPGTKLTSTFIGSGGQNFALLFQRYALHDQLLVESTNTFLVLNDDAMVFADSIDRAHTAVRDAGTDMVTLSDLIEKGYGKILGDEESLSDLELTTFEQMRILNDLMPLVDGVVGDIVDNFEILFGDTLTLSDLFDARDPSKFTVTDAAGLSDLDGVRAYFINELTRQIQDNLGLSDEVARRLVRVLGRIISETPMWNTGGPSPSSW